LASGIEGAAFDKKVISMNMAPGIDRWRCVAVSVSVFLTVLPTFIVGGCGQRHQHKAASDTTARLGLPRADHWQPGLAVVYLPGKFRHTEEMPAGKRMLQLGRPGEPILFFDHSFGRGEVFTSGRSRAIGLEATGFIYLEHPGSYRFKALSNDGIRVWIAGLPVVDDGQWHSTGDRFSVPLTFQNPQTGWAAMRLRYFQRKGTATLKLFWQPPGSEDFEVIPASAYAHSPPID
jgi:hypothetical protein